jgi:hypothetical protein
MLFGTILGLASMFPPTYAPKTSRPLREVDGGATVRRSAAAATKH